MTDFNLSEVLESIKEVWRCPICLDQVSAPVLQCANGHISCSKCRNDLPCCSVCQADFSTVPARALEQVLELIPKKCKYAVRGCSQIVMESHKEYCEFRPIKCQAGDGSCKWEGSVKDWWPHTQAKGYGSATFSGVTCLSYTVRLPYTYCHKFNDHLFLFKVYKENRLMYHCVRHIPAAKPKGNIYYDITIKKEGATLYRSVIQALPLKEDDPFNTHCFSVPLDELMDAKLVINVKISD